MESLLEQPRDPAEYRKDVKEKDFPSFLVWPETQETMKILEWDKVVLDQGAIGHQVKKPSTLLTDIPEVKQLHGLVDDRPTAARADQLEKRIEQSRSWAAWADGLKWVLKVAAKRLEGDTDRQFEDGECPEERSGILEEALCGWSHPLSQRLWNLC